MKKGTSGLLVLLVLALALMMGLLGCDLALSPGSGSLEILLGSKSKSVNWLPEIAMDIASYTIRGNGPNTGNSFLEEGFSGGVFTKEDLAVGDWEIIIDGYNEDSVKIGTATINLTIRKSQTSQETANLRPLTGFGTLDVSVNWVDSQDKLADPQVYLLIQDEHGNEIATYSDLIQLTLGNDGKSASIVIDDIPTGWYEVVVGLSEGIAEGVAESVWQYIHSLRIVKDEITEGVVEIPEAEILFGLGKITLVLDEDMNNPFGLSFTGLPALVKEEQAVTVVASGTYGSDATYRWYVSGKRQGDNINEFEFVSNSAGLFDISLMVNSGGSVAGYRQSVEVVKAIEEVASDAATLAIGYAEDEDADSVMSNLVLPTSGTQGTRITWVSSDPARIDNTGTVVRPAYSSGDTKVQLTATVERGTARETKTFTLSVVKLPQTDAEAVAADKAALELNFAGLDSTSNVTQDVTLASSGASGTTITWQSSIPQTISNAGVVTRPDYTGESDVEVTLTATISKGVASETKSFTLTVKIVLQEQTVTYESNGGSELSDQTVYWGWLIDEPEAPSKVGCSFEGWFTDSELTEKWDFAQDYVRGDLALYAKWGNGYQISFNSQGGLNPNPEQITVRYGVPYGTLATTARAGYSFLGWYTEPEGEGSLITSDVTVLKNENHTLFAMWQANTYMITFDVQGGTYDGPGTKVVTYGQPYGDIPEPTRENHTFDGWWTDVNGKGVHVYEDSVFTKLVDCTLYAKWLFTVSIGPAGGLVFYENMNWSSDGWRYLEAAPYGWYDGETDSRGIYSGDDDPFFQWGVYGHSIMSSRTQVGSGLINSEKIVEYHNTLWQRYSAKGDFYINPQEYNSSNDGTVAAKVCTDYSVENEGVMYDDWFLPSNDELKYMYWNLKFQDQGNLSGNYWSSSDGGLNDAYAFLQSFGDGSQGLTIRSNARKVRPIRRF